MAAMGTLYANTKNCAGLNIGYYELTTDEDGKVRRTNGRLLNRDKEYLTTYFRDEFYLKRDLTPSEEAEEEAEEQEEIAALVEEQEHDTAGPFSGETPPPAPGDDANPEQDE